MNSETKPFVIRRLRRAACLLGTLALFSGTNAQLIAAQPDAAASNPVLPLVQSASRGVVTRDPSSIVKCGEEYWVFHTGRGIPTFRSKDLVKWERGPAVFNAAPAWIAKAVPQNRNLSYWAPDIIKVGARYLLYYSVSSMGKMTSAIGLATTPTLDPSDPEYRWTDQGIVVQTQDGQPGDAYNAIDPALFQDRDGSLWMVFGSYWTGIKLMQLDPKTGQRLAPDTKLIPLAYNDSIEAAHLSRHGDYYYLFVNWGSCCRGPQSTYNIRVGRSKSVTGPYIDKAGKNMLASGGSVFLPNVNGPLIGPGHAGTLIADGKTWFTSCFEGDLRMGGKATLAIMALGWTGDDWPEATVPEVAAPPPPATK